MPVPPHRALTACPLLLKVLFGKLKLHLLSPAKTLPKTGLRGHLSTSEAVVRIKDHPFSRSESMSAPLVRPCQTCLLPMADGRGTRPSRWVVVLHPQVVAFQL